MSRKLLEDDDLLPAAMQLLDDRDPNAIEAAHDDVPAQSSGGGRLVWAIRDAPPRMGSRQARERVLHGGDGRMLVRVA
jgi:hypothetical protein